jgi:hypothetical protein
MKQRDQVGNDDGDDDGGALSVHDELTDGGDIDGFAPLGRARTCALRNKEHPFRGIQRNKAKWAAQVYENGHLDRLQGID